MTLLDSSAEITGSGCTARLVRIDTGVERLAGPSLPPLVLMLDTLPAVEEALAPLLARRADVYRLASPTRASDEDLASRRRFRAETAGAVADLTGDSWVAVEQGRVEFFSGATAVASADAAHPVEVAHLVDAFFRAPSAVPAGSHRPRARP